MDFGDILVSGLSIVGSVLTGGATGLIGSVVSKFFEHKERQQDLEVMRIQNEHDLAILDREWGHRIEEAKVEGASREAVADSQSFAASYSTEPQRYLNIKGGDMPLVVKIMLGFVDFWRGIIRPGLTTYLVVLVTLIYFQLNTVMEAGGLVFDQTTAATLVMQIVSTILYLTTTCVLWWFGTRNKKQAPGS